MNQDSVFHALADPNRRIILKLLQEKDYTPGDLITHFNITKPSLSHHLDILKRAGLVVTERNGQNIIYSLNVSVFNEITSILMNFFKVGTKKGDNHVQD